MPVQKIDVQLQLSQAEASGTKMGHNGEVLGLFIELAVPSLHRQQPTHLHSRK